MEQPTIIIHFDHVLNKHSIQIEESFDTAEEAEAHLKRIQKDGFKIKSTQSLWD